MSHGPKSKGLNIHGMIHLHQDLSLGTSASQVLSSPMILNKVHGLYRIMMGLDSNDPAVEEYTTCTSYITTGIFTAYNLILDS